MNDSDLLEAQRQLEKRLRETLLIHSTIYLKGYKVIAHIRGNRLISTELKKIG